MCHLFLQVHSKSPSLTTTVYALYLVTMVTMSLMLVGVFTINTNYWLGYHGYRSHDADGDIFHTTMYVSVSSSSNAFCASFYSETSLIWMY